MKKITLMTLLAMALIIFIILPLPAICSEATKVLGECTVEKGAELFILMNGMPMGPVAFERQKFYIIEEVPPEPGEHDGGYLIDANGFVADCPHHGREPWEGELIGIIPHNTAKVTCRLFEGAGPASEKKPSRPLER